MFKCNEYPVCKEFHIILNKIPDFLVRKNLVHDITLKNQDINCVLSIPNFNQNSIKHVPITTNNETRNVVSDFKNSHENFSLNYSESNNGEFCYTKQFLENGSPTNKITLFNSQVILSKLVMCFHKKYDCKYCQKFQRKHSNKMSSTSVKTKKLCNKPVFENFTHSLREDKMTTQLQKQFVHLIRRKKSKYLFAKKYQKDKANIKCDASFLPQCNKSSQKKLKVICEKLPNKYTFYHKNATDCFVKKFQSNNASMKSDALFFLQCNKMDKKELRVVCEKLPDKYIDAHQNNANPFAQNHQNNNDNNQSDASFFLQCDRRSLKELKVIFEKLPNKYICTNEGNNTNPFTQNYQSHNANNKSNASFFLQSNERANKKLRVICEKLPEKYIDSYKKNNANSFAQNHQNNDNNQSDASILVQCNKMSQKELRVICKKLPDKYIYSNDRSSANPFVPNHQNDNNKSNASFFLQSNKRANKELRVICEKLLDNYIDFYEKNNVAQNHQNNNDNNKSNASFFLQSNKNANKELRIICEKLPDKYIDSYEKNNANPFAQNHQNNNDNNQSDASNMVQCNKMSQKELRVICKKLPDKYIYSYDRSSANPFAPNHQNNIDNNKSNASFFLQSNKRANKELRVICEKLPDKYIDSYGKNNANLFAQNHQNNNYNNQSDVSIMVQCNKTTQKELTVICKKLPDKYIYSCERSSANPFAQNYQNNNNIKTSLLECDKDFEKKLQFTFDEFYEKNIDKNSNPHLQNDTVYKNVSISKNVITESSNHRSSIELERRKILENISTEHFNPSDDSGIKSISCALKADKSQPLTTSTCILNKRQIQENCPALKPLKFDTKHKYLSASSTKNSCFDKSMLFHQQISTSPLETGSFILDRNLCEQKCDNLEIVNIDAQPNSAIKCMNTSEKVFSNENLKDVLCMNPCEKKKFKVECPVKKKNIGKVISNKFKPSKFKCKFLLGCLMNDKRTRLCHALSIFKRMNCLSKIKKKINIV